MQEVVKKIEELYSLLEKEIESNRKYGERLSAKQIEIEDAHAKLDARSKNVAAMERIYKKYVDLDNEKLKFELDRKNYNDVKNSIEEGNKALEKREKELAKVEEELAKKKDILNRQAIALKEKEAEFEEKKKELKGMLTGEAIKGILK